MENVLRLVFIQHPFHQVEIVNGTGNDIDTVAQSKNIERIRRGAVTFEYDDRHAFAD